MEKRAYEKGQRVEKFCPTCNEQLGHIVKSVTKLGKISRVICVRCGVSGTFKAGEVTVQAGTSLTPSAIYDRTLKYRSGEQMTHPIFGAGEVMKLVDPSMIDVLFSDRVRRLIHDRSK
jgi:transcription elongation factor Elf1